MAQHIVIHSQNPQSRLIKQVVSILHAGKIVILPTDSGYSLCCKIGEKDAVENIRRVRELDKNHYFTLFCRDFSEVAKYAKVDNLAFRFLKAHTPAAITFVLEATREVPKRLLHPKRRTIGIRIPDSRILEDILIELGDAVMSVSVDEFAEDWPLLDPEILLQRYNNQVDCVVDGGVLTMQHTTVVDLSGNHPEILRQGIVELNI